MAWFKSKEKRFAEIITQLSFCNPFLPERIEYERAALGERFEDEGANWNIEPDGQPEHKNVTVLREIVEQTLVSLKGRYKASQTITGEEQALYKNLMLFVLYHRYREGFDRTIMTAEDGSQSKASGRSRVKLYEPFSRDIDRYLAGIDGIEYTEGERGHLFACFYQVRRAFYHIYEHLLGTSNPMVQLRAAIWQSIFTHDLQRYLRVLYLHMGDIATLICGSSGTGKELAARAVGLSRYIPFNVEKQQFTEALVETFFPLNLSALSPTLIESELFGHCKGAYTGAMEHREGWLEICPASGTVFLDEIGELDESIQVKLLRVLQTRTFTRLGESTERQFKGKIITATNRDMSECVSRGDIREDFYYRICSDNITMPSLADRLKDTPGELPLMVRHMTGRLVADEAETLGVEIENWILQNLGEDYGWPGNVRELEQCVRNYIIRKNCEPPRKKNDADQWGQMLMHALKNSTLTADEVLQLYTTLVYETCENYEEAARRLNVDRRTVKSKINMSLVKKIADM